MLRNIQGFQWVIIILAIVILIGWKRLPDAARSLGRSLRIFKSEVEQMSNKDDDEKPSAASSDTVDGHTGAHPMTSDKDAALRNDTAPSDDTAPRSDDRPS